MRARVLISNGCRTIDLFWIEHTGTDVYCGLSRVQDKTSYHASGKVHTDFAGERRHHGWYSPLANLKGSYHLTGFTSHDLDAWVSDLSNDWNYSGKKSDAVLLLDTRSIPNGTSVSISVDLVEAGNSEALARLLRNGPQQPLLAVLAASVQPWVCATVHAIAQ